MTDEQAYKIMRRTAFIWMLGSLITYGHVIKQYKAEDNIACEQGLKRNPNYYCDHMENIEAWCTSILSWPYHWSEVLWK